MRVALQTGQLRRAVPGGIGRYVEGLLLHLPGADLELVPFSGGRWHYAAWHLLRRPRPPQAGRACVVHAPSLAVPPVGSTPLVVTVHDLAFSTHPECFPPRGRSFHERGLDLARAGAAAVIVPSAFTRDELVARGFAPERVHVVHHGIDRPPEVPAEEVDGRLARLGVTRPFLLAVGTIEPRKGLDVVVAAHHRLGGPALVLAGPVGWGEVPGLDGEGVVRPGRVDDADLDALYRGALALVGASLTEGFGLPVLEAMARGCPPVVADAGSLPEVAGDAGVVVAGGDPDALARACASLLEDPEHRAALAAAGRARAATFTWAACRTGHLAAYSVALSTRRS